MRPQSVFGLIAVLFGVSANVIDHGVTRADVSRAVARKGATARQIALQQKDVRGGALLAAQTHGIPGYGGCSSGYQSTFGSGFGGSEAITSFAYWCPSPGVAMQEFPQFASGLERYDDRKTWHYRALPTLKAGHRHLAWTNFGLTGATDLRGRAVKTGSVSIAFQRDNFLGFVEVTYMGETLQQAEQDIHRLAHIMNRRMVLGRS